MEVRAKDVMITPYATLRPSHYLPEAFEIFKKASEVEGELQGMIVKDDNGHLVGVLSMYDVFLFFVPRHIPVWGAMEDIDFMELMDKAYEKARTIRVEQIMTRDPISVTPETSLVAILDLIIKRHIRKIPVVEADTFVGLIYAADVFYYLVDRVNTNLQSGSLDAAVIQEGGTVLSA